MDGDVTDEGDELFMDARYQATLNTIRALRNTTVSPEATIGLRVYQGMMHTHWMRRIRDELQIVYSQTLADLQLRMHDVAIMLGDEISEFEEAELSALMQVLSDTFAEEGEEVFNTSEAIELVAPSPMVATDALPDPCSICIESIKKLQVYRELVCSHSFHKPCIDEWFRRKLTCPMCRESLV